MTDHDKFESIARPSVNALDDILGKPLKVLDDGFIRVVDYMGDDYSIIQAARVSYGKGTKKVSEDRGLIRYLMRHRHTTPFEMAEIKLHVRVPMDTWRQWIRHRTANVNEYSTRYSIAIDATQKTDPKEWRLQSKLSKQGSQGALEEKLGIDLTREEREIHNEIRRLYNKRLEYGVAREQARKDLPLSTYTEAYWKIDLHNLLHFLSLRMDDHAQKEIREYADVIGHKIVSKWTPLVWEAFLDYRMNSIQLTGPEKRMLQEINKGSIETANEIARGIGWLKLSKKTGKLLRNRERIEFEEKLEELKLPIPWRACLE